MRRPRRSLFLHEDVALLALRNDRGTVAGGVMYSQAAGGALLAELLLSGRVRAESEGRKSYAVLEDGHPMGDGLLDECLQKLAAARRRATLTTWVQRFSSLRRLHHRVAAGLVEKGVLREAEGRVLFLFTRRIYPELDPTHEREILARLESAVFSDGPVDPRTTVLTAIAHHAGLLKTNFDRKRLKARRDRVEAVVKGDAIGKATKDAIAAVQAVVMTAAIMPAITAATISH